MNDLKTIANDKRKTLARSNKINKLSKMKDAQSNKLKMYDSVRMALNKHSAEWNGIPYLNNTITEFYAIIQEIIPTAVEQLNDIKAYGNEKKAHRNALQATRVKGKTVVATAELEAMSG